MAHDAIDIREFVEDDLEAVVAFSLRAWEPVFVSIQAVLGDEIFLRLHPDWRADQEETVRSICMNDERDVYVAVAGARPVGFVAVALNAFHECMGVIEIIGLDPDYQRRGVGARLTEFAADHVRRCGMDIAVVETGGDPGHTPARALYGDVGFTLLPIARYFRLLDWTQLLAVRARRGTFPHARARARVSPIAAHVDSLRQWPQPVNGVA